MNSINLLFEIRVIKRTATNIEDLARYWDIYPYGLSAWWCRGKLYDEQDNAEDNLVDAMAFSIIDEILKEEKNETR